MADAPRVLVVDDESMMRDLVSALLEMEGYVVEVADGGRSALEAIQAHPPDLVLLDLNMPGVSGWDVIDRLKEQEAPPPVIAMSGMGVAEPPELYAVRRFVYGYLPKPFSQEQLAKTVARAMEASHARPVDPSLFTEHRREPRRTVLLPGTLVSPGGTPAAVGQILNLSPSGAHFDLGVAIPPGTKMTLDFDIPGGHGSFRVTARIEWRRDSKLGLSFVDMSAADRRRLEELLARP
jgi:CheY-like chemotaxis protein